MDLVKMAPDGWAYYATEIAGGREDYFAREEPGRWLGQGAERAGLAGEVDAVGLERLFAHARHPTSDDALGRPFGAGKAAVAGYALSFSPPKSVSVLWALGPEAVADQVRAGHDAAVRAALSYLERHAAFTRRGKDGVFQTDTLGLLGAAFTHRTSRALDPQLHTHVLLANKMQAATDGKWLSLDGSELYANQKAAGMLYKAALRAELTARLKLSWTPVDRNGIAEIEGVPQELVDHWSTRRKEVTAAAKVLIAEREQALGRRLSNLERSEAHQLAAYRTRGAKGEETHSTAELRAGWREEAEALGLGPSAWAKAVARPAVRKVRGTPPPILGWARALLEESSSTWTRADVVEVMTTLVDYRKLPGAAELDEAVEQATEALLSSNGVLQLTAPSLLELPDELRRRDGCPTHLHHGQLRYSTEDTLAREAGVLDADAAGRDARVAVVDEVELSERMAAAGLGLDQQRALWKMCLDGEAICVVIGPAGAGKTRMLAVARAAFEAEGHRVLGLAPSATAAKVLEVSTGMKGETLARFLSRSSHQPVELEAHDVVVLDEATMARSADLALLVGVVGRRGAKLVCLGDPAQLGAVGAGGLFRTLAEDTGAVSLGVPRRFVHVWEKKALLRLRARDQRVIETYARHDRIASVGPEEVVETAFALWSEARAQSARVLLLASDYTMVDALNERARAEMVRQGRVEADGLLCRSQLVGRGDEVVTLRNDRSLRSSRGDWVRNGDRWSVLERGRDGSLVFLHAEGRGQVRVPAAYVAEHVDLAYALTVHKAQGTTVDRAVVVVDQKMTAEQLYVAMSRGREHNQAVVVCEAPDTGHGRFATPSAPEVLSRVLRRQGADQSATAVVRGAFAAAQDPWTLSALVHEIEQTVDRLAGKDVSAEIAGLRPSADVERAAENLRRAEERQRQAAGELAETERRAASLANRLRRSSRVDDDDIRAARWQQKEAGRGYDRVRHELYAAEQARAELDPIEERQRQRERWIEEHPQYMDTLAWAKGECERARQAQRAGDHGSAQPTWPERTTKKLVPALGYDHSGALLEPDYGASRQRGSQHDRHHDVHRGPGLEPDHGHSLGL
jgi:conjugative relaxase-like TrwC/TraI family protein